MFALVPLPPFRAFASLRKRDWPEYERRGREHEVEDEGRLRDPRADAAHVERTLGS